MLFSVKKYLFEHLSLENYLRFLQRSYFLLYRTGMLRKNPEYAYHYFVKKLVRPGNTVIDIGANLGYYSLLFSEWVGSAGHVYAVEPIELYNRIFMERAARRRNITLLPYALGDEEKEVLLVTSPRTGYLRTGLPHIYDAGKDGRVEEQEFTFEARMKVPSELFASVKRVNYIKCDIEGFEYVVLSQMREMIGRDKPRLQVEVWKENAAPLYGMLLELGYRAYRLEEGRLAEIGRADDMGEGDILFIHRDDPVAPGLLRVP